jgi:arginase
MNRPVELLGVPMDLGADRRGVDMGPSAIRYGGLADELEGVGLSCTDGGDLSVPRPEQRDPAATNPLGGKAKYFEETRTVCGRLTDRVSESRANGNFPLVLGGDHSIAIGTANGVCDDGSTGVLWFDAHADLNTPQTTPSGNIHGMPLAGIIGQGVFEDQSWATAPSVSPENVAMVGIRTLDEGEKEVIRETDVTTYTMTDIDKRGITSVVRSAIEVATQDVDQLYVSFDMDFLDPSVAPGVGTPVRGGASYREAHTAMELLYEEAGDLIGAMDVVETNPILDEHNETAELAVELAASALGKRIL